MREGWNSRRLDEIVRFQRGHDLTVSAIEGGPYPVAGSNGVIGYHKSCTAKGPGITLGRSGNSIGVAHFYERDFWAHNTTLYSKEFCQADPKFVFYLLRTVDFKSFNTGSAVPSLNRNHIHAAEFAVPPLKEQEAIASVLSSLDDKIDLLHRQNRTLELMAETLFRQWFVVGAKEEWPWHELGEFVEVMRGLSYNGAGLTVEGDGVPMHNLNSVYEGGGYKYDGIKYYNGDFKDRHRVFPGDVIVTNTEQGHELMLIGYPALVPKYFGQDGIFTQHVYKLRIKEVLTEPFIYHLLKTWDMREQVAGATNGSTVNMLNKDGIEWAKFRLPPTELIEAFTAFARPLIEKQENNYVQALNLTAQRDTLLPKLMSGEVRVEMGE